MIIDIQEAKREGAKVVLGLAGTSGSGKTYTALQVGFGLANLNGKKLGLLDTENGRGKLYADELPGGERFLIGELKPPFSPERYIQAIQAFEAKGVEVLVIDSGSHEWEGTGGCEEIATGGNPKFPRWNIAKAEHKKFMNVLLQSSMHIIVCLRAREKQKITNVQGKQVFESQGLQPICEKNMMFEMTASCLMQEEGKRQDVLKCPKELKAIFGRGNDYLTVADGQAIRAWVDGATPVDRKLESFRATLANTCEQGTEALKKAWETLPKSAKKALEGELAGFKASAEGYDKHRSIANGGEEQKAADDLNAAIEGDPTTAPAALASPASTENASTAEQAPEAKGGSNDGDIFGGD